MPSITYHSRGKMLLLSLVCSSMIYKVSAIERPLCRHPIDSNQCTNQEPRLAPLQCVCSDACLLTGQCCMDYNPTVDAKVELERMTDCLNPEWLQKSKQRTGAEDSAPTSLYKKYRMVRQCHENSTADEDRARCEKVPATISEHAPVSLKEGVTFRNIFCASCNGYTADVLIPWTLELEWQSEPTYDKALEVIAAIQTNPDSTIIEFAPVKAIRFYPPNNTVIGIANGYCDNKLLTCLNSPNEKLLELFGPSCQKYHAPIAVAGSERIFKNPFCALCSGTIKDTERACEWQYVRPTRADFENGYKKLPTSLTVAFSAILSMQMTRDPTSKDQCASGTFFDPKTASCREFECPRGMTPHGAKCVDILEKVVGMENNIVFHLNSKSTVGNSIKRDFSPLTAFIDVKSLVLFGNTSNTLLLDDLDNHVLEEWMRYVIEYLRPSIPGSMVTFDCWLESHNASSITCRTSFRLTGKPSIISSLLSSLSRTPAQFNLLNEIFSLDMTSEYDKPIPDDICAYLKLTTSDGNAKPSICVADYLATIQSNETKHGSPSGGEKRSKEREDYILGLISFSCTLVSNVAILLTIVTFCLLPKMRQARSSKTTLFFLVNLLLAQVSFQYAPQTVSIPSLCAVLAKVTQFLWLSTFGWLTVHNYTLMRSFLSMTSMVNSFNANNTRRRGQFSRSFCLLGSLVYVCISIPVGLGVLFDNIDPSPLSVGYGNSFCWISNPFGVFYLFAIPIAAAVLVNIVTILTVIIQFFRLSNAAQSVRRRDYSLVIVSLRMLVLSGAAWVFGFANMFWPHEALAYLFTVMNTLQGVFVFFAFVCKKRVKTMYSEKYCNVFGRGSRSSSVTRNHPRFGETGYVSKNTSEITNK